MRVFDQRWSSNGTSGGQTGVYVSGEVQQSAWFFQASTGVSTARISVQSAQSSAGPWAEEAASTHLSSGTAQVLRVNGPHLWIRPFCGSTGITVRAVGM